MSGWTKLFSCIVTSSVWCEPDATVRVWIAMLAVADADGIVEGSIPGFANLARVTVEQMRQAVEKLSSPDPDSRTHDYEGRRIEIIAGGWRLLNYGIYRERAQEKEGSRAPYMRAYRARRRAESVTTGVTAGVTCNTEERGDRKEARERKNGLAPAAAGADAQPVTLANGPPPWNRDAADDWIAAYGGAPPGMFFKQLKPAVEKYGWERVRPVLRFYLAETAVEHVSIAKCLVGAFPSIETRIQRGGTRAKGTFWDQQRAENEAFERSRKGGRG